MNTENGIKLLAAGLMMLAVSVTGLHAADGTYDQDADGNWSDTSKWQGGTVADGDDATAEFKADLSADRTVTIAPGGRTVGHLEFEDTGADPDFNWVLDGGPLSLSVTSGNPSITVNSDAVINSAMSPLNVELKGDATLTINGDLTMNTNNHENPFITEEGTLILNGELINAGSEISFKPDKSNDRSIIVNGEISGSTGVEIEWGGDGNLMLFGENTYTGPTQTYYGQIHIRDRSGLGQSTDIMIFRDHRSALVVNTKDRPHSVSFEPAAQFNLRGGADDQNLGATLATQPDGHLDVQGKLYSSDTDERFTIYAEFGSVRLASSESTVPVPILDRGTLIIGADDPADGTPGALGGTTDPLWMGKPRYKGGNRPALSVMTDMPVTVNRDLHVTHNEDTELPALVLGSSASGTTTFGGDVVLKNNDQFGLVTQANQTFSLQAVQSDTMVEFTGDFSVEDPANDTANVRKLGQGSVKLSGSNSYNGTTVVRSGALLVGGDVQTSADGALGNADTAIQLGDVTGAFDPVRVATTGWMISGRDAEYSADYVNEGSGEFHNAPLAVDGVDLAVGDRILVWKQALWPADTRSNGIYEVTAIDAQSGTSTWDRVSELDGGEVQQRVGHTIAVQEGVQNAGKTFFLARDIADINTGGQPVTFLEEPAMQNPSLLIDGAFTVARDVMVQATGTGDSTLGGASDDDSVFSGAVALGKTVNLASQTTEGRKVQFTGELSGAGGVNVVGPGEVELTGANTYVGATDVQAGTLRLNNAGGSATGAGAVTVQAGAMLAGDFTIDPNQATGDPEQPVVGGDVTISGTLAPGNSAGTVTLDLVAATVGEDTTGATQLVFTEGSTLAFDVGTTSDLVSFAGPAGDYLGGSGAATLALTLGEGFSYDDVYTIFANVTTPGFTFADITGFDTGAYTAALALTGSDYVLSFSEGGAMLAGDANGDGQVDGNDLIAVEENFGATGQGITGDANGDGQVDGNDLIAVEENFGATSAGSASVPEPTTLVLLGLCGAALARTRR